MGSKRKEQNELLDYIKENIDSYHQRRFIPGKVDKDIGVPCNCLVTPENVDDFEFPDPDDPTYSLSVDLLAPEGYGEIIGGGQRASDLDLLRKRIEEHGLPEKAFEWYLDLRRYGTFPHAGFGLGVERTLAWICGIQHVRETIPFPRLINRLSP